MNCTNCNGDRGYSIFLTGARLGFGVWLTYVGLMKWQGIQGFVEMLGSEFQKTWSPMWLTTALAWLIAIAEPVIGIWILSGKRRLCAWNAASALMFLLMFGLTMLQKPEATGVFQFFVFTLFCASMSARVDGGACS